MTSMGKKEGTAQVILVGDELLAGEVRDKNGYFLASSLKALGYKVTAIHVVPDNLEAIANSLKLAQRNCEVTIVSGGLGPTSDDRTAEAAAMAFSVDLELHQGWLRQLETFLKDLGMRLGDANKKQALLPRGAAILNNRKGTAPGFVMEGMDNKLLYFLPGVPSELSDMFEQEVAPDLASRAGLKVQTKIVDVFGLPEAVLYERLDGLEKAIPSISLGFLPEFPVIHVKVVARTGQGGDVRADSEKALAAIEKKLGDHICGRDMKPFATSLVNLLKERGKTLALAESCTGGRAASLVTEVPGASSVFKGCVVAYHNEAKQGLLNVPLEVLEIHGAVSAETASAMAEGVKHVLGADIGLAVTGIAGPSGGTPDKPVGLIWFSMSGPWGIDTYNKVLKGPRHWIQSLAGHVVLDRLRKRLL
ncbi:MAG: CinA family nicotinamide mononucleotide deamidase-related protein [Deltaproteobacteria bacterium]|nr:CinA family nicotinamide mononucleotide deamidase-related protein [Deltaproteobacteria bacterium]